MLVLDTSMNAKNIDEKAFPLNLPGLTRYSYIVHGK